MSPSSGWACRAKKTHRASEQTRAERAAVAERVKSIAAEDLVFVDETGVSIKLTWLPARAPRGQRAYGVTQHRNGTPSKFKLTF